MVENLPNEEWRNIVCYPNYQVSNLGRVKSLHYKKSNEERILKSFKLSNGYLQINLCKEGKMKTCYTHRLIAEAFIPNPNNLPQINHKDECKENNTVENLEWCTSEYNNNYGTKKQRTINSTDYSKIAEKKSKEVIQCDLEGNEIARFPSTIEIERLFGFSCGNISKCCNGKLKTAYGYIWRYA